MVVRHIIMLQFMSSEIYCSSFSIWILSEKAANEIGKYCTVEKSLIKMNLSIVINTRLRIIV